MAPEAADEMSASPPARDGEGCVEPTAAKALHFHVMNLLGHCPSGWL